MDHLVKDCAKKKVRSDSGRQGQPRCYTCYNVGNVATHCPPNVLAVTEKTVDQSMLCSGMIEGQQVDDILLDTGCSRTLVHQWLVPSIKYLPERRSIRCAHGDQLAEVGMEINGVKFTMEVAVAGKLPRSVVLGTDAPILWSLLSWHINPSNSDELGVFAVTRAQIREDIEGQQPWFQKEVESGVQSHQFHELSNNIKCRNRMRKRHECLGYRS